MRNSLNFGTPLNKEAQKSIVGGKLLEGNFSLRCNSGVWITSCPDNSSTTGSQACRNQGGYSGSWFQFGN